MISNFLGKFNLVYLARWIAHCEKTGLKYYKGNLRSWIAKMSNLFSVEEFMMVDYAIKWEFYWSINLLRITPLLVNYCLVGKGLGYQREIPFPIFLLSTEVIGGGLEC